MDTVQHQCCPPIRPGFELLPFPLIDPRYSLYVSPQDLPTCVPPSCSCPNQLRRTISPCDAVNICNNHQAMWSRIQICAEPACKVAGVKARYELMKFVEGQKSLIEWSCKEDELKGLTDEFSRANMLFAPDGTLPTFPQRNPNKSGGMRKMGRVVTGNWVLLIVLYMMVFIQY